MAPDWTEAIARARAHAPFLARGLDRFPDLAELLARGDGEQALLAAKQAGQAAPAPDRALRLEKNALALVLAIGHQYQLATAWHGARPQLDPVE